MKNDAALSSEFWYLHIKEILGNSGTNISVATRREVERSVLLWKCQTFELPPEEETNGSVFQWRCQTFDLPPEEETKGPVFKWRCQKMELPAEEGIEGSIFEDN